MKKTNVALFHSATRWVRYLPLLLCFIAFSSSDLAAQNFKSPEDAAVAVKEALEQVIGDLDDTDRVDQVSNSQKQVVYTYRYYTEYLERLADLNDTEEALLVLEKIYPVDKRIPSRKAIGEEAYDDLMDLITE